MKKSFVCAWLAVTVVGLAAGCDRAPAAAPKTFDDPMGPIVKTTSPFGEGVQAVDRDAPNVSYFANGYAKLATADDRRAGRSQIRFYNPMNVKNEVTFEVLFDNRAPEVLETFTMEPNRNDKLFTLPAERLDFFEGSEAWGARITSTAPIIVLNVLSAGVIAPGGDLWFGNDRFKGANTVQHATRTVSKRWFFGDGLTLVYDEPPLNQLFQEYEWYHVLNPNKEDVEVKMHCHYTDRQTETYTFTVKGERVRIIDNKGLVRPNQPHAVELVSSAPVLAVAERFIYDFKNMEEWGAWLHANHDGIPVEEIEAAQQSR